MGALAQIARMAWGSGAARAAPLALRLDGIVVDSHHIVAAVGVDAAPAKHLLWPAIGATENAAVFKDRRGGLVERGPWADKSRPSCNRGWDTARKAAVILHSWSVAMEENGERRLPFDGAVNFRDLGGYDAGQGRRTRWRCLYRSDSLADLTEADLERLAALNLHGLIDFRVPQERQSHPNRLPAGAAVRTVEIGFWPEVVVDMLRALRAGAIDAAGVERETLSQYRRYPVHHKAEYRLMMETIEEAAGRPMLIHCVSGKDRTGFGAAVILMALGVTQTVILEDYLLTNSYRRDIGHLMPPGTSSGIAQTFTAASPLYLEAAFATIKQKYGSVDAYLEQGLGFDDKRRANLRDLLTEE